MNYIKSATLITGLFTSLLINTHAEASSNVTVQINGQALGFDQPPVMENNRVLVPMRTIFEVVGAKVEWDAKTSTVKAKKGDLSIILPLNSKQVVMNGNQKSLDVPAKSINGRTLVPLRFVSEALGCKVDWLTNRSLVKITFDGEVKEQTGKVYPDGWVAPILKSAWSPYGGDNLETLQNELGFTDGGRVYSIEGASKAITLYGGYSDYEVTLNFSMWDDDANGRLKQAYRIPIVAKELLKLYFASDANRVWNYLNTGDMPDQFKANGRIVVASYDANSGILSLDVGRQ